MTIVKITNDMFNNLEYDAKMETKPIVISEAAEQKMSEPTVMIVLSNSDLNAAAYHLTKSLENSFAVNAIATVLVQESILADFTAKVQQKMVPYQLSASRSEDSIKMHEKIKQVKAKTIRPVGTKETSLVGPTIVCDFTHEQLGATPGSLVTLTAFRTAKEALALCNKQGVAFANCTIWSENHACAYEMIAALRCKNFFINCFDVSLDCLNDHFEKKSSFVTMDKSYHYETIADADSTQKNVVFPFGTIFAN